MYVASIALESYNTKMTLNAARFISLFSLSSRIREVSLSVCDRAFLALDVVLWFIRLLILLMIDRTVGPMLLMIQAMVGVVCALCGFISACTLVHAHWVILISILTNSSLVLSLSPFSSMIWSRSSRSSSSSRRRTVWHRFPYWKLVNRRLIWRSFARSSTLLIGEDLSSESLLGRTFGFFLRHVFGQINDLDDVKGIWHPGKAFVWYSWCSSVHR